MANLITTTLVINFAAGDNSSLAAEIDSRENGLNGGITSFIPGDSPAFLIYKTANVSVQIDTTTGSITDEGSGLTDVEEILTFTNSREVSLSKPAFGTVTTTKLSGVTPDLEVKYDKLITSEKTIGAVKVEYQTKFYAYRLNGVPDNLNGETTFPIIVLITGTTA